MIKDEPLPHVSGTDGPLTIKVPGRGYHYSNHCIIRHFIGRAWSADSECLHFQNISISSEGGDHHLPKLSDAD